MRKTFTTQIFVILLRQSDIELLLSEMQTLWGGGGVTNFVFEIKHVENYPSFDNQSL